MMPRFTSVASAECAPRIVPGSGDGRLDRRLAWRSRFCGAGDGGVSCPAAGGRGGGALPPPPDASGGGRPVAAEGRVRGVADDGHCVRAGRGGRNLARCTTGSGASTATRRPALVHRYVAAYPAPAILARRRVKPHRRAGSGRLGALPWVVVAGGRIPAGDAHVLSWVAAKQLIGPPTALRPSDVRPAAGEPSTCCRLMAHSETKPPRNCGAASAARGQRPAVLSAAQNQLASPVSQNLPLRTTIFASPARSCSLRHGRPPVGVSHRTWHTMPREASLLKVPLLIRLAIEADVHPNRG